MFVRKILLTWILIATPLLASAQQEAPKPAPELLEASGTAAVDDVEIPEGGMPHYVKEETPKERQDRLGTSEDPGINPDPEKVWIRYGKKYNIRRYEKEFARFLPERPNLVRPVGNVNFTFEIYQLNDKYVWAWINVIEPAMPREERTREENTIKVPDETIEYLKAIRDEFTPLEPPAAPLKVTFEESSDGLPKNGSWRNAGAVADMNNDGFVDIVLPPQRAGNGLPAIFLGDGKGKWRPWSVTWPTRINYGAVVAADFNKDKKMDLAFSIHLSGVAIFFGDGKGDFTEAFFDRAFPSRRLITSDVDHDGWMDIVAITEGPTGRTNDPKAKDYTGVRAYLNRAKGTKWEGLNIAHPKDNSAGDWLATGYFNNDKYPDFLSSTIYFNGTSVVHLSQNAPKKYDWFWDGKGYVIPFRSYYYAMSAGRFTKKDRDDALVSHYRVWPPKMDQDRITDPPLTRVVGIDRISFAADGKTAQRSPVMRWAAGRSVPGLANGDFDRDGKLDIVFTRHEPREAVLLLGDGKGGFARAQVEGLTLRPLSNYDLTVADVNGDSRPDVIVMYEAESATSLSEKNGSVQVFLNKGTSSTQTAAAR